MFKYIGVENRHRGRKVSGKVSLTGAGIVTAVVLIGMTVLVGGVSGATNVSSCQVISSPGVYMLNASINGSSTCITIESSDVIFDGAGYAIDGADSSYSVGVYAYNSTTDLTNVTVKNLRVTDWYVGIWYINTTNGIIENNTASNNDYGIFLTSSTNNTLANNTVNSNSEVGISVASSTNNTLANNTVNSNSEVGIWVYSSTNNALVRNEMSNNSYNLYVSGTSLSQYNHLIDASNSVDGKPVYYNVSVSNYTIDSATNAGFVGVINSTNVTVRDVNLTKNRAGVLFAFTNNSKIQNVNASNNPNGIYLYYSNGNTLTDNNASNNDYGIYLDSSSNNTLVNNTPSNNQYGIHIDSSSNNTIANNTASSNNVYGIRLSSSSGNTIANNTAKENNKYDMFVTASSDGGCNNIVENNIGSGDRSIKYFNYSATFQDETLAELILCNADNSQISNVTIEGSATKKNNMLYVYRTDNSSFTNINSSNNYYGIYLYSSSNNTLTNNNASSNNEYGIHFDSSNNNTIANNNLSNNTRGIYLIFSTENTIRDNTANLNGHAGVGLRDSDGNTIRNNNVPNNGLGIWFLFSDNNTIYHNNLINNTQQASDGSTNTWDSGYPGGGNYWSDYSGSDSNNDGIGDTSYSISGGSNDDRYPFTSESGWINSRVVVNNTSPACTTGKSYFSTIQAAVDANSSVSTIVVCGGTYNENVDINKSINLIGTGADVTIVNASNSSDHVFEVTVNSLNITGFNINDAYIFDYSGIFLNGSSYSNIWDNRFSNNHYAIFAYFSNGTNLSNNEIGSSHDGIRIENSSQTLIKNNSIKSSSNYAIFLIYTQEDQVVGNNLSFNGRGLSISDTFNSTISNNTIYSSVWDGILLGSSENNTIYENLIKLNPNGIRLSHSGANLIENNSLISNNYGLYFWGVFSSNNMIRNNTFESNVEGIQECCSSGYNQFWENNIIDNGVGINFSTSFSTLYHNNIINNTKQVYDSGTNTWNNDSSGEGNYWSDYDESSEGCDDANADGFCDSPYNVSGGSNQDMHPFVNQDGWDNIIDTQNGTNVSVVFPGCGMNMTFDNVTGTGKTTGVRLLRSSGIAPPSGYKSAGIFYNISTTANLTGSFAVCVMDFDILSSYRLFHWAGTAWEDITTTIDADNDILCGTASSLSPFEVMEPSSDGGSGGGGGASKPKIILLANSIDYNLSSNFMTFLKSSAMDVVYTTPENFSNYNTSKFIVILGGPDAYDGVGEIVREVLNESEQDYLRASANRKMYVKTNVWARGQVVMIIAGSDREQTRQAGEGNKLAVRKNVKGY